MKKKIFSFLKKPPRKLWVVVASITLLLHAIAIQFLSDEVDFDFSTPPSTTITAELKPLPTLQKTPPIKPRQQTTPASTLPDSTPEPTPTENPQTNTPHTPETPPAPPASQTPPTTTPLNEVASSENNLTGLTINNFPPSIEIHYDVTAIRNHDTVYGSGKIHWLNKGTHYEIHGEANILFITILEFHSQGVLNSLGLAPLIYSEKPRGKSLTNTHFQQNKGVISFSTSPTTYTAQGGEQDRASLPWQLSSAGRTYPELFQAQHQIDIRVAGARDMQTWRIQILQEEIVETPLGKFKAWHLVRHPTPNTYEQKIEIWLTPQKEWYPVKLRYTNHNGDILEMLVTEFIPIHNKPAH